jgi:hypothetical protein
MIDSLEYSLSKLGTVAKEEQPIAKFLNKTLFVFLTSTFPIFTSPSQADMAILDECNRAFTNAIVAFIKLYCVKILLLHNDTTKDQDNLKKLKYAQSKYTLDDSGVQFIIDNNLLVDSNEEINDELEKTFFTALSERKDINYVSGMTCHIINYYSRVMDEIELFLPQKKMVNSFLLFWMKGTFGIDVN